MNVSELDIQQRFKLCDSIDIIDNIQYDKIGFYTPYFQTEIIQIGMYAKLENITIAGEESVSWEEHYIWTPWKWYNLRFFSRMTGCA